MMATILFILKLAYPVHSLPIDNKTAGMGNALNGTSASFTGWKQNPRTRGTLQIISTCLLTLTLCVWTSLHLNIPRRNLSKIRRLADKIAWVLVGIFVPELVLYMAWTQLEAARRHSAKINAVIRKVGEERGIKVSIYLRLDMNPTLTIW